MPSNLSYGAPCGRQPSDQVVCLVTWSGRHQLCWCRRRRCLVPVFQSSYRAHARRAAPHRPRARARRGGARRRATHSIADRLPIATPPRRSRGKSGADRRRFVRSSSRKLSPARRGAARRARTDSSIFVAVTGRNRNSHRPPARVSAFTANEPKCNELPSGKMNMHRGETIDFILWGYGSGFGAGRLTPFSLWESCGFALNKCFKI